MTNKCYYDKCTRPICLIIGHCKYCDKYYCNNHRLPEEHKCTNIGDCRNKAFIRNKDKLISEKVIKSKV